MTEHLRASQLPGRLKGSHAAHEALQEAVRVRLALAGLKPVPIYTGGIPKYLPGGQLVLRKNQHQAGMPDMWVPYLDTCASCRIPRDRVAFLEFKSGQARRSAVQVRFATELQSLGFLCLLVRRVEDVEPIIEAHRNARRLAWPATRSR